jgi:single-strand DNA-binding protein
MSNTFHFSGRLAEAPTLRGTAKVCRFRLLRNEFAGLDEANNRKERVVSIDFTAFGGLGETIARTVGKGDQLIIEARIVNNNYTDDAGRQVYGHSFIVFGFEYGAKSKANREVSQARGHATRQEHHGCDQDGTDGLAAHDEEFATETNPVSSAGDTQ